MPSPLLHLFLTLALSGTIFAQAPLSSTSAVRSLPLDQSEQELPVDLQARVAHIAYPATVFIQDSEAGTFFRTQTRVTDLLIGDLVRVRGTTFKGLYLTGINATQIEVLSHGSPPPPQDATFEDLTSGRFHYQLVRIRGVIRSTSATDDERTRFTVALGQQLLDVRLNASLSSPTQWDDTLVEIQGLAAGGINDRRQLVQPHLLINSESDIHILSSPVPPTKIPPSSPLNLLRFRPSQDASPHLRRARLKGQLLAALPDGQLFLRDLSQTPPIAFAARLTQSPSEPLHPGDLLDLVGFPEMSGFSARLRDALILTTSPGPAPNPLPTRLSELTKSTPPNSDLNPISLDSDLVTLTAQVTTQTRTPNGTDWQLRDGNQLLNAHLQAPFTENHLPGTLVTLSGICQIESSADQGFRAVPSTARLLLPNAASIRLLKAPPWWTPGRLISLIAFLAAIVVAALIWITLLRRRVTQQTESLRSRIATSAALEERQRIAREFHDTLEQELAGLSIRLGALGSLPLEPKADSLLTNSLHLVSRIQTEARNLVADLRSPEDDSPTDLTTTLQELASRQSTEAGPQILWHLAPNLPSLPGPTVHHLRMITQEALTNALKHAQATQIDITTSLKDHHLHLTISDNGIGLPTAPPSPLSNHFGQIGIQERARKIQASVHWHPSPTQGTTLHLTLPLP
jgi:signal transduction histidine kinase